MAQIIVDGKAVPFPRESPNETALKDFTPIYIILHSTGGGFAGAISWLLNKLSRVSAHFVVSRTGEIRQLVSIYKEAWHAGKSKWDGRDNLNRFSIGVELEHYDGKQNWPLVQRMAVESLCAVLCKRFSIRPDMSGILGHAAIAWPRGRKIDPKEFPWNNFYAGLQRIMKGAK